MLGLGLVKYTSGKKRKRFKKKNHIIYEYRMTAADYIIIIIIVIIVIIIIITVIIFIIYHYRRSFSYVIFEPNRGDLGGSGVANLSAAVHNRNRNFHGFYIPK